MMINDGFDEFQIDKSAHVKDLALTILTADNNIARCRRIKEECEKQLAALLEHPHEGSKTYEQDGYKILVKATVSYEILKDEYAAVKTGLSAEFDPLKEVVSMTYRVNNEALKNSRLYADSETLYKIDSFLKEKGRKLAISIGTK